MDLIAQLEAEQVAELAKDIPDFKAGDTIRVGYKVTEGTRTRVQNYEGVCISRKGGSGIGASFTVRKISFGEGVERVFPLHSPIVSRIEVMRRGDRLTFDVTPEGKAGCAHSCTGEGKEGCEHSCCGKEIGKYRPALVLSSRAYNRKTGLMICCPVSSSIRGAPTEVAVIPIRVKQRNADKQQVRDHALHFATDALLIRIAFDADQHSAPEFQRPSQRCEQHVRSVAVQIVQRGREGAAGLQLADGVLLVATPVGASNHFPRRVLDAEPWDPFNVTEDADLGIRVSSLGQFGRMPAPCS